MAADLQAFADPVLGPKEETGTPQGPTPQHSFSAALEAEAGGSRVEASLAAKRLSLPAP